MNSKHGLLGSWPGDGKKTVSTTLKEVTVVAGESLDFFLQSDGDVDIEFEWKFTEQAVHSAELAKMVWNSSGHFDGPSRPLNAPRTQAATRADPAHDQRIHPPRLNRRITDATDESSEDA